MTDMKRTVLILLSLLLLLPLFTACDTKSDGDRKIDVVCLSFAEYDWARNIVGDNENVRLTLLRRGGVDIHSYQPTASDLMKIYESDLFIYVASPSFSGFDDAVESSKGRTLELLSLFEDEEHHDHDHEHGHDHDHATDEHIWLSLSHAQECCEHIAAALSELDKENAHSYSDNSQEYIAKLEKLDSEYRETIESAKTRVLVFADRFPFSHMAHDYSLECFAAFSGCTGESAASYATFDHLISKVDENSLDCILTVEGSDQRIARTVVSSTKSKDQTILTLDSMQALGKADVENGVTYLSVMQKNLETLREALG